MDPQAANRLIQTQPQKADAQAREWNVFASQHSEISHFVLKQEFDAWARTHGISDTSVWFGKEVQEAYFDIREQHNARQREEDVTSVHTPSIPVELAGLPFLALMFLEKPRILEEDKDYQELVKQKKEAWLKNNPGKDTTSKEWIDYRYGSLENPDAPTLYADAEKAFREDVRFTKRVEQYDKERKMVYKNLDEDPAIIAQRLRIERHAELLYERHKKQDPSVKKEDIVEKVKAYHWEKFVEKNEDKAKAYAEKHEGIKSAVLRMAEQKKQTAAPKIETKPVVQQIPPQPLQTPMPEPFFSLPTMQPPPPMQQRTVSSPPPPRTPSGGGNPLGNFLNRPRNPLSLGSNLARQAALRLLFLLAGPVFMVLLFTFAIVFGIGPATTSEASPELGADFIPVIAPPPNTKVDSLRSDISSKFHVEFDPSFDSSYYNYLKWAWEVLWSVDNTRFQQLFNPNNNKIKVIAIPISAGFNEQYDCGKIGIRLGRINSPHDPYDERFFKIIFTHELTHLIENCLPDSVSRKSQLDQIIKQEGFLTNFSKNSGTVGNIPLNEDYAESFAYFINQNIPELKINICSGCDPTPNADGQIVNPYQNNKPLHQQLVIELLGITLSTPSPTPSNPLVQFSCPVAGGGETWIGSFQADFVNGHCGSDYNAKLSDPKDQCQGNTRRGKSLDIIAGGKLGSDIELPTINERKVEWIFEPNLISLSAKDCFKEEIINPQGLSGGCGTGYVFNADLGGGKNWVLHLLHMGPTSLQPGQSYPSGTIVGKSEAVHVHISMGQDIKDTRSQDEPGWKSVDTELKLCQN